MTIGPTPPWPNPPASAITAPPSANSLYNKHTVQLQAVKPLGTDSLNSQVEEYEPAVALVCNVQVSGTEPTAPGDYAPYAGKIFAVPGAFKARDLVTHQNRLFRILGVKIIYENLPPYAEHHIEGFLSALDSSVD